MILTHLALFSFLDGAGEAAAAATAIWPPHRLRPKRIILPDGRMLVARTDADYQLAIRMALESRETPDSPPSRKKAKRRARRLVVEVSSLPEPDGLPRLPAGFYDSFARWLPNHADRLADQIAWAELLRLRDAYLAEQEEEEAIAMILLAS